jgi:uncharacterized membrane protein
MFGLDLHPAVVHFPIALAVVGAFAEVAYQFVRRPWIKWFGPILLTLALAGSGVAYFSGQAVHDKAEAQGVPNPAIEKHETSCVWALCALGLATLLSWAVRPRGKAIWLSALIAIAAMALTLYTGYLGGELVYVHGAGRVGAGAAQR